MAIVVNAPLVVSETLNGESVIMHHRTGHYFNTIGSGALIWESIEAGAGLDRIVQLLEEAYGLGEAQARDVAARFIGKLEQHDLIRWANEDHGVLPLPADRGIFEEPELGIHDDLADMLLLDPIHDVDEVGWPAPRQAVTAK